jgi:hypothetical protein
VEYLAGLGFDHLRIPIDEEQMWDNEGKKYPDAFNLLHQALNWCQKNGLNKDSLEAMFHKPLELARATGLRLYCGEWGAISNAPLADRLRWYQDMQELFEKHILLMQTGTSKAIILVWWAKAMQLMLN